MVERLFLAMPRGCLQFVIVVFPDHTHYFTYVASNLHIFVNIEDNCFQFSGKILRDSTLQRHHELNFDVHNHKVPFVISWPIYMYINTKKYLFKDYHHRFQRKRSCENQLVMFVLNVLSRLYGVVNNGHKQTDCIIMFWDRRCAIKKAFVTRIIRYIY